MTPRTETETPLVYACAGSSPEARLAEGIARELEERGLAERSSLVAVAAERPDRARRPRVRRPVVAIDGCQERCCVSVLVEHGVPVSQAIPLYELADVDAADRADLVERVVARLSAWARSDEEPEQQLHDAPERSRRSDHARNRYLRALLDVHPARSPAAAVARALGVTRPSAGQALEGLRRKGLVERHADKTFALTAAGVDAARTVVRRQRIVECFLADFAGYPAPAVRELATPVADALTEDAVDRLYVRLGAPARCPHGQPIDPVAAPRRRSCSPAAAPAAH